MTESLKLRLIKNAGWLFSAEVISKLLAYEIVVLIISVILFKDIIDNYNM